MSEDTIALRARCHCGLASFALDIPKHSFPLKSAICSCNSCRRVTGQLFASFAVVPDHPVPDVSALTTYASSPSLNRVFCPRCGCSVLNFEAGEWEFASGVLEGPVQGLLDRQALFAGDSVDGGGYLWLPEKNGAGNEILRRGQHRDSEVVDVEAMRREFETSSRDAVLEDRLEASCHCGAFQCYITRPLPDAPAPHAERGKWWLAQDGKRYKAGLDACNSCRQVTGFDVISWAFIPAANFLKPDGSALDPSTHPKLRHYETSSGVHRDFCGTCGAATFFRKDSRDPKIWDICVGVLKSKGARAGDWLEWQPGVDFAEFAIDPEFVGAISEKMKSDGLPS